METAHTIQQVAQQADLSIDTLRHDERIGLLEPITKLRRQSDAPATERQRTPITRLTFAHVTACDWPITLDKLLW